MAIPSGSDWNQYLNDQINKLVKFRDNVAAAIDFENVATYKDLSSQTRTKVVTKINGQLPGIKTALDDIAAYLANPT